MNSISVEQVERLLEAVKSGDESLAATTLKVINEQVEVQLMDQIAEISQNLDATLTSFGEDGMLLQQTKHDIPDAAENLEYVMKMTEEASNKTLAASENASAMLETLMDKGLNPEAQALVNQLQSQISEIMMAQSFQDLTGQVLNRIIFLVTSLEQSLHELIARSGIDLSCVPDREVSDEAIRHREMKGMGPLVLDKDKQDSAASQADVDDLLGDLGI